MKMMKGRREMKIEDDEREKMIKDEQEIKEEKRKRKNKI